MSLRIKMMVSIFAFMILVVALLTLNLWLDAAARAKSETRRNADLIACLVYDWFREAPAPAGTSGGAGWEALSRKLSRSALLSGWTFAASAGGRLRTVLSNEPEPEKILEREADLLGSALRELRIDAAGPRVYMPLETEGGEHLAARLTLKGSALPSTDIAYTLKGILTVMAVGTALLLLNTYIFINRFFLRPLGTLVEASNRAAAGDFSKRITEAETYDEMGRMIRAFNLMTDKIAEHRRTLEEDIRSARGKITATERRLFAAQRLSTAGTLAAGIAHEINNPLGGMINATRAIREGRLDEAKRQEYTELISDGLERVRGIVQKILQLRSRPFEPRPVPLREAVEQAASFLRHRAEAKGVQIRNELPPDLPTVNGDPQELQQAFLNVLMNAVDACVMGEGVVTVAPRAAVDAVSVTVADNGCGMEAEELARCQDPFFTTKDVGEGTGLGLSVARNIVANHGGKLDIESRRGSGTVVTLTFPRPADANSLGG